MTNTTLSINFYSATINDTLRNEFHSAINYENADMNIQLLDTDIARLETRIANLKNNQDKTEEEKSIEEAKVEEAKVEETPVAEILQMDTNVNTDTPDAVESVTTTTKTPLDELLKNNELTEDQVVWSDYTKAERRQIRAHLNALAAENA